MNDLNSIDGISIDVPISSIRSPTTDINMSVVQYERLKDSIRGFELICPIIVRPIDDMYIIVEGRCRYQACLDLGYTSIRCVVVDSNDYAILLTQMRLGVLNMLEGEKV